MRVSRIWARLDASMAHPLFLRLSPSRWPPGGTGQPNIEGGTDAERDGPYPRQLPGDRAGSPCAGRSCGRRADPADRPGGRQGRRPRRTGQAALFRSPPVEVGVHLVQLVPQPVDGRHRQPQDLDRPPLEPGPDQRPHGAELQHEPGAVLGRAAPRTCRNRPAARSPIPARWAAPTNWRSRWCSRSPGYVAEFKEGFRRRQGDDR